MAQRLEGTIRVALGHGHETLPLMLAAAQALAPHDLRLGRDALLEAMEAAIFFRRSGSIEEPRLVARAAGEATPPPGSERTTTDVLLDGFTARFTDGYSAAVPHFRRAVTALRAAVTFAGSCSAAWLPVNSGTCTPGMPWRAAGFNSAAKMGH